jgi:hypothetical protein
MKVTPSLLTTLVLTTLGSVSAFAGTTNFNFDIDPATDPSLTDAIIVGNHYSAHPSQIWSSGAGIGIDGNPATGGYLSISDATNGGEGLAFVFPDIDAGAPLSGFQIDLDLRVGNGTLGRPADGFSISFARAGDVALVNATNGVLNGFAGGDGSVAAAAAAGGSGDVENGTKTGVSVVFDSWQGNYLPDTPPYSSPPTGVGSSAATDREGIAVRLDDHTLTQIDLILNRNEKDCVPSTQTTLTNNGTGLSLQTGTNSVVTSGTGCSRVYGANDTSGAYTNLVWQHLTVRLTNNPPATACTPPTFNLLVTWKGVTVINTNLANFSPYNGRLILAGRTGGNNQNVHADNIRLFTRPVTSVFLGSINGLLNGFTFTLNDNSVGGSTFSGLVQVLLDTTNNVTAQTTVNYTAPTAQGTYQQAARFTPGSTHTAQICWRDSNNNTNSTAISFVVPPWFAMPTNFALPLSAADTSKPGFRAHVYQTLQNNPNQAWWTEQQVIGHKGPSTLGTAVVGSESAGGDSFMVWDGPVDFANVSGGAAPQFGFFSGGGYDNDFNVFGLGNQGLYPRNSRYDVYNNSSIEFFGYVYFPTSGVYNMVMGSDDGFQLSVSQNSQDRMGQVVWFLNGNRTPTPASPPGFNDIRPVVVDQAGLYPVRLLWENGGGAAALEWYTTPSITTAAIANFNSYLVNDTNNPGNSVFVYRAVLPGNDLGPYVRSADPVRGDVDVPFYAPIKVVLNDGTGSKTVNQGTVAMTVDGSALAASVTRSGNTVTLSQTSTPNWSGGSHTNVLTFADSLGTNYTYTWTWTVLGGVSGVARADVTNAAVVIPASAGVPLGQVDTSRPGYRIKSYQSAQQNPSQVSFYEEQFQGMHGQNVADQSTTNGPGFWTWADGVLSPLTPGVIDFRSSYTGTSGGGSLGTGAGGKYPYDFFYDTSTNVSDYSTFGIGALSAQSYPNAQNFTGANKAENSSLQIGTWLYFPNAGTYIMYVNSDDGAKLSVPYGYPFDKLGTVIFEDNIGRGMVNAGGVETGGSYGKFTIPAPGAYPFRLFVFNAGTDGGIEWTIYQQLSDGTVHRVAINDANIPESIKAYQTLIAGDVNAPYVSYANPAFDALGTPAWAPIVVDITDGTGTKAVNSGTIQLKVDGTVRSPTVTHPTAGLTHIALNGNIWVQGAHTNILTYQDNAGNSYSNWWPFSVPSQTLPFTAIQVPLSNRVDISQVDTSQPGFRVKSYQTLDTASGGTNNQPNTITWTEEQFAGLHGPNIANQAGTNGPGFFVWNGPVDFAGNINFAGNATSGEYRYNQAFSNYFGFVLNGGGTSENDDSLMFAGWMVFPQAGYYLMTVNSDDGFKITSPYGSNPFSQAGTLLGQVSAGRGNSTGENGNPFAVGGSVSPALFNIPAAGAYPIRMLWENGGGGLNVEWVTYQYFTNGDVARVMVGENTAPGALPVYQTLLIDEPYVFNVFPSINPPLAGADLTLTPGIGGTNSVATVPDLSIQLQDGFVRTVNTSTISLTFRGVTQPINVSANGAGLTTIIRRANDVPFWPSGAFGPLTLTFQDNTGKVISETWNLFINFWGTLTNALDLTAVNTNQPGFALRLVQVDGKGSTGTTTIPTRIHVAEQILSGLWGTNSSLRTNLNDGQYWDLAGTDRTNGTLNLNIPGQGAIGDFQPGGGFPEKLFPGLPGAIQFPAVNGNPNNNFAAEFLAYVEFPTNGTYTLGVSSDDGFRLTRGFTPPASQGALVVNSPAGVSGAKPTVQNTFLTSYSLTSAVTGNLAIPNGISFLQGSTTNGEGCVITDTPGTLNGKILLMYRSAFCSYAQQVANAAAAGAIGVVLVQNRPATEGLFPQEPGVNPPTQPIPAVEIEQADGNALAAILATNGTVNITMTPMENLINPPADNNVMGQADVGKGASDVLFPVVVQQAGVYPLRLLHFQGGGGGNCEFFSVTGTNRVLINDRASTNGPGPGGSGLRAWYPITTLRAALSGNNVVLTFSGTLQSAPTVNGPWTDVVGATSPYTVTPNQPQQFYRARLQN